MNRYASLVLLAVTLLPAAEMRVSGSAIHGRVAVLSEGATRLEVALTEGVRIVSWRIDSHEIGFVGRIWGGDLYDRYTVNGASGDTRFRAPSTVELLRQPERVAVRARFDLGGGVVLQRTLSLGREGLAVEASFTGTDDAWYEFAAHLVRPKDPEPELRYAATVLPLRPKEVYQGLPRDLAVTGLATPALVWHFGEGIGLAPRVWDSTMSLGLAGTYRGTPLRALCQLVPMAAITADLPAAPPFPAWEGTDAARHRPPVWSLWRLQLAPRLHGSPGGLRPALGAVGRLLLGHVRGAAGRPRLLPRRDLAGGG